MREAFTTTQLADSLKQIKGEIVPGTSVGLFIMPRIFTSSMTKLEKSQRVQALVNMFPNNKVTVFANKRLLSQFTVTAKTEVQPTYARLMNSNWGTTHQFASADQYNIFADLKNYKLTPFLINPNDEDQKLYAESYIKAKTSAQTSPTILQLMTKYQCNS